MTFKTWTDGILGAVNDIIIPLIFALTFVVFMYGVYKYFLYHGAEEEARRDGRQFVLWGILGMVLMFAIWGVVNILLTTLGLGS